MDYDKIAIIKDVVENGKSKRAAAVKLCRSLRSVNRMIKLYTEKGPDALIHGNTARKPVNALDYALIFNLYENLYYDFTMTHLSEILKEREHITVSEATIRNIFKENDTLSVKARRKTKRALKRKLAAQAKLSVFVF